MKTKIMLKFSAALMIFAGLVACQNTDRSGNAQLDSAPVGSDSLRKADSSDAPNDVTQMSKVDGDGAAFMDTAAVGGMMEVDLGKLALEKSTNSKVKEFAALMVADHTKANTDLKAIAAKLEHLLPSAYPADVKAHMDAMKKLKGKAFDAHYMNMMVNDHVKTLALFRSASSLRSEIRDFAARTLPVLEKHNQMATQINASLK
jgi:Predicted outer membrane protein